MHLRTMAASTLVALLAAAPGAFAAPGDVAPLAGGLGAGQALELSIPNAGALAADGTRLLSGDGRSTVRWIDPADGSSEPLFATSGGVAGIARDAAGNVYALESDWRGRLLRRDAATGAVTVLAGGGTTAPASGIAATSAQLTFPKGLAIGADGDPIVVDGILGDVRSQLLKVDADSGRLAVIGGRQADASAVGDGGPVDAAYIGRVAGISLTSGGDLLVTEGEQFTEHRVRRVLAGANGAIDGADTIERVAGTDDRTGVSSGDGGPARDARLHDPSAAVELQGGDVAIAELGEEFDGRVRVVDAADGTISTLAGGGSGEPAGQPATDARLPAPVALQSIGSTLYVGLGSVLRDNTWADGEGILAVALDGSSIAHFAGNGRAVSGDGVPALDAQLSEARGMTIAPDGATIVADGGAHELRRVDPVNGQITTIVGNGEACAEPPASCGDGGPGRAARLSEPTAVAVAPDGTVFWAEAFGSTFSPSYAGGRIRALAPEGTVRTVAGTGAAGFTGDGGAAATARFRLIGDLAIAPDGALHVADTGNNRVRRIDLAAGIVTTVAGTGYADSTGDGGPAASAQLDAPGGLAFAPDGDLLIAVARGVRRVDSETRRITTPLAVPATPAAPLTSPAPPELLPASEAPLERPLDVAARADGTLAVATATRVWFVEPGGPAARRVLGTGVTGVSEPSGPGDAVAVNGPASIAFAAGGDLVVADTGNRRVLRLSSPRPLMRIDAVEPSRPQLQAGGEAVEVALGIGTTFGPLELRAGNGVTVSDLRRVSDMRVVATLRADATASAGPRQLVLVTTGDGAEAVCDGCLTVLARSGEPPAPGPSRAPAPAAPTPPRLPSTPAPSSAAVRIGELNVPPRLTLRGLRRGMPITATPRADGQLRVELRLGRDAARRLRARGTSVLASTRMPVKAGKAVRLRLKPTPRVLRRISRGGRRTTVSVTVRVTLTGADGTSITRSLKVRLRT
ncbi:hypothetical protein VSS74_02225 [Conexibacter stalactiti]|uniref:Teneurin NHL domain-containing protein n=1 Tax=Conexibacter stalactiti TaxID=1940611 RepID=A0ABU4HIJ5_9ACTN|nr:hypothetical protein [Conexibacter stalactiti]MDW5593136.1 hypothetical protein [Conexibacter stalactiti]MEC5033777.1 hypothetical protein [Conexibacter stalactiti]